MNQFELKGTWKGEYVYDDKYQPAFIKTAVPFVLKINAIDGNGLFEGLCQDDPRVSQADFPADIYGSINGSELIFNKKYRKTAFRDQFGNIVNADEPQTDVIYQATVSNKERIVGTWRIERTFRKINGRVMPFGPVTGIWWMARLQ